MGGEKTEEATPKRLADARAKGDVPQSRDLVAFASLAGAVALASVSAGPSLSRLRASIVLAFSRVSSPENIDASALLRDAAMDTLAVVLPITLGALVAGGAAAYLDAGPVFAPKRLIPDLSRVDPSKGASQLFTTERFVDLLKSFFVLGALAIIALFVVRDLAADLVRLVSSDARMALATSGSAIMRMLTRVLAILAAVAVADIFLSRKRFAKQHRMSKDEVVREHKESEGDPQQKQERARMHREILEHSVLEGVRRADVLVVNPTHLAIALRFDADSEQAAPEVVGKGEDELAQKMIEVAREAGVPVLRDIPLAHGLYRLELGEEIPEELFEAVAAVLRAAWDERESSK